MKKFGKNEKHVARLFPPGKTFDLEDGTYKVLISGKPKPGSGECKTDVYVLAENLHSKNKVELKISFKAHNAEFLENKMTAERAQQILGKEWKRKISKFISQIEDKFKIRSLIYKNKHGKTEAGSFTLGWKMEFVNCSNGKLSGDAKLTIKEVAEVYGGYKLSDEKRNSKVNGSVINNSGIADYVLAGNIKDINTTQEAVDKLVPTRRYAEMNPDVYFVCKALNYRSFKKGEKKHDGNRPLSVYVEWNTKDKKLTPALIFDNPLGLCGDDAANQLKMSLECLNIKTTDDINPSIVDLLQFPSLIN